MNGSILHLAAQARTLAFSLTPALSLHVLCVLGQQPHPVSSTFQIDSKDSNSAPSPSPLPWSGLFSLGKSSTHRPLISLLASSSPAVHSLERQRGVILSLLCPVFWKLLLQSVSCLRFFLLFIRPHVQPFCLFSQIIFTYSAACSLWSSHTIL